jgi:hypothetical protein
VTRQQPNRAMRTSMTKLKYLAPRLVAGILLDAVGRRRPLGACWQG